MAHRLMVRLTSAEAQKAYDVLMQEGNALMASKVEPAIPAGGEVVCLGTNQHAALIEAVNA